MSRFLIVEELAAMSRVDIRTVRDWTAQRIVPFHRLPGTRRCLFDRDEIAAWEAGARFEFIDLPGNGVTVRQLDRVRGVA